MLVQRFSNFVLENFLKQNLWPNVILWPKVTSNRDVI